MAGFAQTKSLEAKNRKTTTDTFLEKFVSKLFLPKKNNNSKGRARGQKRGRRRGGGPKGEQDRGLISAGRPKTTEVIERSMPLFSARSTKRLRYSTNLQLTSTAGAVASYVFAANGLYDPDITGTGHQPMGFDEMMLYYNHYCVLKCNIQAVVKSISGTKLTVCIRQDGAATPLTTIDRIVEVGGAVIEYMEFSTTFGATKRLQAAVDIARLQGISRSALTADSTLRGTIAANPAELTYFHIQTWDAAAQTGSLNIDVILDFVAVFIEPRDITSSLQARMDELYVARRMLAEGKSVGPVQSKSWLGR